MIELIADILLLTLLAATGIAIVRLRDLVAITMLFGVFSLLSASLFLCLDAPDVAFTESAVGAGVSTVLLLASFALSSREEKPRRPVAWTALGVCVATGTILIYGMLDMPDLGAPNAAAQLHVAPDYITRAPIETGVSNLVTAILAGYRAYDTLGETLAIVTSSIAVLLLLGIKHRKQSERG